MKTNIEKADFTFWIEKIKKDNPQKKLEPFDMMNLESLLVDFAASISDLNTEPLVFRKRAIKACCFVRECQITLEKLECLPSDDKGALLRMLGSLRGLCFDFEGLTDKEKLMLLAVCEGMDEPGTGWLHEVSPFYNEHVAAGVVGALEQKGLIDSELVKEKGLPDVYYVSITKGGVAVAADVFGEDWKQRLAEHA